MVSAEMSGLGATAVRRRTTRRDLAVSLPDRVLVEAELLSRSLHRYLRAMWSVVEPGRPFVDNWHLGAICEVLEAVTRFELRCVVINVPPRSGKSVVCCVAWPTWVWTRPQSKDGGLGAAARFLCVSHDLDLVTRDSVRSRRVIESEWYQRRWGHVYQLTTDQNVKTNYENNRTGYRLSETVGSSVVGKGGDYRLIDDPHKTDAQESDSVRETKLSWLREEFWTRYTDPARNGLVLIMQRLHERDMSGFMLTERLADYHLCIPMRYEVGRKHYLSEMKSMTLVHQDLRSQEGELMWPSRFGEAEVKALEKALGRFGAAGQLQQRPVPRGGGIVTRDDFRFYRAHELPPLDLVVVSVDAAFKEEQTSSYVVIQVWGRSSPNSYLLYQRREQMSFLKTLHAVREVRSVYPSASAVLIEDAANGPAIINVLRREMPGVLAERPLGSKNARAEAAAPLFHSGHVWVPDPSEQPWVELFISEWCSVPTCAFWDQVDASTQYLNRFGRGTRVAVGEGLVVGGTSVDPAMFSASESSWPETGTSPWE